MSYWRGWRGTQIIFIPRTSRLNIFLQAEDGIRNHCVTGVQSVLFRSQAEDGIRRSLCDWSSDVCSSDRKSTRLNSSHTVMSYAVFCLKKKKLWPLLCLLMQLPFLMDVHIILETVNLLS